MRNTNILPLSTATYEDQHIYWVDKPIVAEGIKHIFYGANGSVEGYNVAVATIPVNSPSITLDAEGKDVGTYTQTPRNMFVKKQSVIAVGGGGSIDAAGAKYPSAVWDSKRKRFLVYYLGENAGGDLSICVAYGASYATLVKYYPGGTTTAIIAAPAGYTVSAMKLEAEFNKEENLFKLWYTLQTGGAMSRWLATSRDGIAF